MQDFAPKVLLSAPQDPTGRRGAVQRADYLIDRFRVAPAKARALYAQEFARLARGATVRSYLALRTTSNVLAILRRRSNAHEHLR
jgi:hypothetical protein